MLTVMPPAVTIVAFL